MRNKFFHTAKDIVVFFLHDTFVYDHSFECVENSATMVTYVVASVGSCLTVSELHAALVYPTLLFLQDQGCQEVEFENARRGIRKAHQGS
jgi:hypothetical protein